MTARISKEEQALQLARERGLLRSRDFTEVGIAREYVRRLYERGLLERVGRGLYAPAGTEPDERRPLAEVAKRVPHAVVCLLSALRFHDLTTQAPFEVWIAIDRTAWRPRIDYPPLRIVRFGDKALTAGVEEHEITGVGVRVYSPAKTVADCFKYRNKVGLDVALEALREAWAERRATMDELWHYARVCRVAAVMRPYLESLV
jgi:predicted transcriptional regulator of viral defense system